MILKWLQSITGTTPQPGPSNTAATRQADEEQRRERKDSKLIDVAHEALSEGAATEQATLEGLVNIGLSNVKRNKFKGVVRNRVWNVLSQKFGFSDPDMVEEITERLVDAALSDRYYREMFEDK